MSSFYSAVHILKRGTKVYSLCLDFASYADGNTIYDASDNIDEVIFSLQDSS